MAARSALMVKGATNTGIEEGEKMLTINEQANKKILSYLKTNQAAGLLKYEIIDGGSET